MESLIAFLSKTVFVLTLFVHPLGSRALLLELAIATVYICFKNLKLSRKTNTSSILRFVLLTLIWTPGMNAQTGDGRTVPDPSLALPGTTATHASAGPFNAGLKPLE